MNRLLLLFALLWLAACTPERIGPSVACTADPALPSAATHPKAAAIQALMDRYVAKGLPGVTVLIADSNGLWYGSAGYASLEDQVPMQPCHLNKLGSVTKMMMGALVWTYIQEGQLDIDAPIGTYIPEVAAGLPYGDEITLGMLLDHSSGIYDIARDLNFNLAVINDFSRSWTAEEILAYVEGKAATHRPGTAVNYSNTNTLLEGMILEAITGRPHAALLQERIFDPLGMNSTVYYAYDRDFPVAHLAQGYLDLHNDGGGIQNISALNPGSGNGYTGVYATVTDLYRFMRALLAEPVLISPENLAFIAQRGRDTPGGSWRSSPGAIHDEFRDVLPAGVHAYGHAGGDIGYSANLNYLPHNGTIFAATYNYGTNLSTPMGGELDALRDALILLMAE